MGAGVEPGRAAPELEDVQVAALEVDPVDVGDLELAPGRGLEVLGDLDHLGVVEVEARDREARAGLLRLLLYGEDLARGVELDHAVALGVAHAVGEHPRALRQGGGLLERVAQLVSVEDVVAQDQTRGLVVHELGPEHVGLRQAFRRGLGHVAALEPELAPVA